MRRRSAIVTILLGLVPAAVDAQVKPTATQQLITPRAFVGFGITQFLAGDTFEAVFGDAKGATWTAGGQFLLRRGFFVELGVERFRRTGQRVFVFEGVVIPLGVADTVTITPITAMAGFRFAWGRRVVPYVAGGVGSYLLREESAFAVTGDNVDSHHVGYLFALGSEFRIVGMLGVAGELQFASVPDGLGDHGVSHEFAETNLGGRSLRVKFVIGR